MDFGTKVLVGRGVAKAMLVRRRMAQLGGLLSLALTLMVHPEGSLAYVTIAAALPGPGLPRCPPGLPPIARCLPPIPPWSARP